MLRQLRISCAFTVPAAALAFSISVQAGASRTFVATTGNDNNINSNCLATGPCRSFAAALAVTNSEGEIVVLDSGGYGPATIAQSVIIAAVGVDASITAAPGGNALTINAFSVTLIGLNLHGEGAADNGIEIQSIGNLRLYNMLIENFSNIGVDFPVSGNLTISGSTISDSGVEGLVVNDDSANAYVHDSSFDNNSSIGVLVFSGNAVVADSSAQYNGFAFDAAGGSLTLFNDRAVFNGTALVAQTGGVLNFAYCLVANNSTSYNVDNVSTMYGTATSLITAGQSVTGTLGILVLQ